MIAIDFLQDNGGDLLIKDGDFVFGASDNDHVEDIISAFAGEWKEFPLVGVGIMKYLNSAGSESEMQQVTKQQLKADGYDVKKILFDVAPNGTITITSDAIRI